MSRLRIAEDRRKFTFYRLPQEEREKIAAKLAEILREREEVEVALVFGGFVTSEVFRDIDVAVFTAYRVKEDQDYLYEDELAEQAIHISVNNHSITWVSCWGIRQKLAA